MITLLLCILFSNTLQFNGLTLVKLLNWFNGHPFLAIFVLIEILSGTLLYVKSITIDQIEDNSKEL